MNKGDVLLKKWCFGINYKKPENRVEMHNGEAHVTVSWPMYRSIAVKILSVKKKGTNSWEVEAERYASLKAKPKKVKLNIKKTNQGTYAVEGQKRVYHRLSGSPTLSDKLPPVGSLVTLNKKHAIVCSVRRNEMTVFVDGGYITVGVIPGKIKWREDNIIASMPKAKVT